MTNRARKLAKAAEFKVSIPEPFDFDLTVAKPAGWNWCSPGEQYRKGVIWAGLYGPRGPVGLKVRRSGSRVTVEVFCDPGGEGIEPAYLRPAVESGLSKEVDLEGFYGFAAQEPVLSKAVEDLYGMRPGRLDDLFGRVILAISLQMAQLKRSRSIMEAILKHYGTRLAFDEQTVVLWPPIQRIAAVREEDLREKANMGYRAKLLRSAAAYLIEHPMTMVELEDMEEEAALETVRRIPGIGEYSAGIVLGRSSAPIDAWSIVIMSEILLGRTPAEPRRDIDAMNALLRERWGKWGWLAFVYVMNDLANLSPIYHLSRLT